MKVRFKKLSPKAVIPARKHQTDAGFDLTATSCVFDEDGNATYGFGLAVEIPKGYVGLIFPRSSICEKDLSLSNAVGVIDSGYRGEIKAKFKPTLTFVDNNTAPADLYPDDIKPDDYKGLNQTDLSTQEVTFNGRNADYPDLNEGCFPFPPRVYKVGDRIAQIIIMPYPDIEFEEADELSETDRGDGGFGSSNR